MNTIISSFINGKQKTNLHTILCLKRIFHDGQRPLDQSFQQREISNMWDSVRNYNRNFLNAGVAPVYITKQKFISRIGEEFFILEKYRDSFSQINWDDLIEKVQSIKPLFTPIHEKLVNEREDFLTYAVQTLNNPPQELEIRLIPALLEIFSYAVLKTHLKYFGADIFRWTRTNSNDGGVDMTCGNVSYSITTNLDYRKMYSDATKQVRDRLNFITIRNRVPIDKIREIEQELSLTINLIELSDLSNLVQGFNDTQKNQLLNLLKSEIEKEL